MTYQSGKIYKLFALGLEDICYVGSTVTSLDKRHSSHVSAAKNVIGNTQCRSHALFEERNEVVIELLEDYPCNTKAELEARERYWIGRFPNALNRNIPGQTWKERWAKNKERNSALHKEWLEKNKESEALKKKERRLANPDAAKAADKESYERNKAARLAAKKEKVVCEVCQKSMNKNSLLAHKKTHTK
jgi:hypothetical protein